MGRERKYDKIYDGPAGVTEYLGRDVEDGRLFLTGYIEGLPMKEGEIYTLCLRSGSKDRVGGTMMKSKVLELRDDNILWELL